MATRFAVASGNYSSAAIWDNGAVPLSTDDVFANGFTVAMDTNITALALRNTASGVYVPNIATPVMTGNSAPSGVASASSTQAGYQPYFAFDQSSSSIWYCSTNAGWLSYQFPTAKTIRRYAFLTATATNAPKTWTFEGSNDGSTWTTLDTQTNLTLAASTWYTYAIASPASYTYYRINVTVSGGQPLAIPELNMTESTSTVYGISVNGSFNFNTAGVTANVTGGYSFNGTNAITITATTGTVTLNSPGVAITAPPGSTTVGSIVHSGACDFVLNASTLNTTVTTGGSIVVSKTSTGTLTVNASNLYGSISTAVSNNDCHSIYSTVGNVVVNGNIYSGGGIGANTTNGAVMLTGGNLTVTGNVIGGAYGASGFITISCAGIYNTGGGTVTVTGNVTGGPNAPAIGTVGASTIIVNGNVTASSGAAPITNTGTANITINGTVTASSSQVAITSTSTGIVTCNGSIVNNSNGMMAIFAQRINISASSTQTWNMFRAGGIARDLLTPDQIVVTGSFPAASDVRLGTTYGLGTFTGTLAMPSYLNVTLGVPVDAGVGAAYTPANIADLVWNKLTSTLTVSGSAGERIKNIATVDITGYQIAALKR